MDKYVLSIASVHNLCISIGLSPKDALIRVEESRIGRIRFNQSGYVMKTEHYPDAAATRKNYDKETLNEHLLEESFDAFKQTALELQAYYHEIKEKVDELNGELLRKNEELQLNLLEKEQRQNFIVNILASSAVGCLVTDSHGVVNFVNQRGLQLIGKPLEKLHGVGLNEVFQHAVLPQTLVREDLRVYDHAREQELEFRHPNGSKKRLLLTISSMRSEADEILGIIINAQDISDIKKLEAEAERKNRLTGMGEMGATIAHKIRNPLGSIELFSALLKKDLDPEAPQQQLIEHIASATQSMNHIISNILEYTKPCRLAKEKPIEVHELLRETLEASRHEISERQVHMITDLEATATEIKGDRELLKQVFHNLISNAFHAILDNPTHEPGKIFISTRNFLTRNETILKRFHSARERNRGIQYDCLCLIEICIQDTGMGMPPEVGQKIFSPFFTTKENGIGLGLATVHNIVDSHGAVLDVESEVDQGTRMTLLFPVLE